MKLTLLHRLLTLCCSLALSFSAHASLAGYPVILIQGFQPAHLKNNPSPATVEHDGMRYWESFWSSKADARIDWPSHERIRGKIATDYLWPKLQQFSKEQLCVPGCIIVSHSTGDLVTRYLLDHQALWLTNAGLSPLNIVATFDFAGAGGGTELADLALNIATGETLIHRGLRAAIGLWLNGGAGEAVTPVRLGVLQDLRINSARQLAPLPDSRVPRLRIIGAHSDFFGLTSPFLPGQDDGVIASHSSCAAQMPAAFSSCSSTLGMDGKISTQQGVSRFMPWHYAVLMSHAYSHSTVLAAQRQGNVTAATTSISLLHGSQFEVDVQQQSRGFWRFQASYRFVAGSEQYSLSEVLYQQMVQP